MENASKDFCTNKATSISNLNNVSDIRSNAKMDESMKPNSKKSDLIKEKPLPGLLFLKQSFRTLSIPKKSSDKDKNEPSRFLGEGVAFKAKLIGILEVEEARGDKMCQEALLELKMAVRAAGEHKQRINIVIAIDGIRLREEKTGDCLHHHPVHKISFIAQDVADSRAFGYIFGSPDTTHRFFGIKTDKAASQVVMAMKDLFQAVYELKKREVDMAKQNIEHHQLKYGSSLFLDSIPPSSKSGGESVLKSKIVTREDSNKNVKSKTQTAGVIADLVDLELELNSLQQGLSQMQKLTPSDPFGPSPSLPKEDPFGDSFTPPPCITTPPPAKLPPPPASGDRRKIGSTSSAASQPELHWFDKETQDLFSSEKNPASSMENPSDKEKKEEARTSESTVKDLYDIFTELDPLGTGRSKPYMDKKDFFQELKNPPKKLLKDLKSGEILDKNTSSTSFTGSSKSMFLEENEKLREKNFHKYNSVDSHHRITLAEELAKSDPHYEASGVDPFETSFANFATFDNHVEDPHRRSPQIYRRSPASLRESISSDSVHSTLKSNTNKSTACKLMRNVTSEDTHLPCVSSQTNESFLQKYNPSWNRSADDNSRQKIIINLRKVLSSADDTDKENDSPVAEEATVLKNIDAMSPVQGDVSSDSFESIPEPPPRPITSPVASQPPPLPPKKLQLPVTMKPPPRPASDSLSHYDYIENYESLGSRQRLNGDVQIPPLPAPARKPKFGQDIDRDIARHRPYKQSVSSECEYYLTPISKSRSERDDRLRKMKPSLNITISQLTGTDFEDLAAMLRIPASALSKMTLKELTECLSRLSDAECQKLESDMSSKNRSDNALKYRSLRESFDDDSSSTTATFKANFEEKFPVKPATLVDKYAVFRELIEQEEKNQNFESKILMEDNVDNVSESIDEEHKRNLTTAEQEEKDKYAALRKINAPNSKGEESLKESSEKEDSASEVILQVEDSEHTGESVTLCLQTEEVKDSDNSVVPSEATKNIIEHQSSVAAETTAKINDGEKNDKNSQNDNFCENELGRNWAKFDSEQDSKERKPSPWQKESKDSDFAYQKETKLEEVIKPIRYRKQRSHKRWNDDEDDDDDDGNDEDYGDDSEENWESSKKSLGSSWDESSWRENGWSDRDSLYDDAEASPAASYREQRFQLRKKGYRRKFSPHKKSVDHSPWEEEADWQTRKSMYKDIVKDNERIYEERKVRTPPWTSDRKRYEPKEEDELMLLKMMLGKKRLKALEDQLFKHYHEQLSEPLKKSYYYAKSSSKDSPCDEDYSDMSSKPRYNKKYYAQRPKSADKGRKPLQLRPEDTEELFSNKKYRRPYSHDELSISEEEKWTHKSPAYKKQISRSRNQSQTSPFEDNFAPQPYEFTDSLSERERESMHIKSKTLRYPSASKKADSKKSLELHPYSAYDFKSGRSSRESSQRQSPFEDDFTPPEVQKSGDVGREGIERRNDDEIFYSGGVSESLGRNSRNNPRSSRLSRHDHQKRIEKPGKYYENVDLRKPKIPDSYYEKIAKEKYKYATKEDNGETCVELKSPKKTKNIEGRRHDPFNDNVSSFDSKTVPRLQKMKNKNKVQNYDSESDTAEGSSTKWKDDLSSFTLSDQHGRK